MKKEKPKKLAEIAALIRPHLEAMEKDPSVNREIVPGIHRFYKPEAGDSGRYVWVRYVAYQPNFNLTREEALAYLAWLNGDKRGTHWDMQREN